jgi:hypothetical protein
VTIAGPSQRVEPRLEEFAEILMKIGRELATPA